MPGSCQSSSSSQGGEGGVAKWEELPRPCPQQPCLYWIKGTESAATEIPNSLLIPLPIPVLPCVPSHPQIFLFSHSSEFLSPEHQETSLPPAQQLKLHPAQLPATRTILQPFCYSSTISPNSCGSGHQAMTFSDSSPRADCPSASLAR